MPYLLIRQKFTDYEQWRTAFDSLTDTRREAGMNLVLVTRNVADPDEAVILFEVADPEQMRGHATSSALQEAHKRGGVVEGSSQMTLLQDVTG